MPACQACGEDNPSGGRFCSACGAPLIASETSPAEVRKTVTVVFTDLVGSTALGERLDPESLRSVTARYFDTLSAALERHGGTVEKFIGDAVMAVFGIPQLHEDDALRATRAAVEMREQLTALNEELARVWGVRLQIRTGINTGKVVAGEPSAGHRLVTGDAVNVAARLEQAAGAGEILLGDETERLVRSFVRVDPVEALELKGKARPVSAYRLREVLADVPAFTQPLDTPFIGRERELELLEAAFQRVVDDRSCHLCTIVGPPGIGKSRLARELTFGARRRARVVIGRCLPYGEGITYWPLVEIAKQLPGTVREAVAEVEDSDVIVARIESVIGVSDESAAAEEISWAFRRLFETLASERPLIVVVDDIHWAEPTLLDLLEYMVGFSSGAPILLACMARSDLFDARPSWSNPRSNTSLITLEPLIEREASTLVERLIGDRNVALDTQAQIVEAAEGNPLFVEQLLAFQADRRESGAGGELELPATLKALLAARIDGLEADERAVLELGAVEGRLFHRGAVAQLLPERIRSTVGSHLLTLARKEFIRPDRSEFPGDDGFRFGHILIRDAAYDALPKERRADLHERFADWLEQKVGGETLQYEEILGYHFEQAYRYRAELGPPDATALRLAREAGNRLGVAGRRAYLRGDTPAAVNLLTRACQLLSSRDESRPSLLLDLGSVLVEAGDFDAADRILAEAGAAGEPVVSLAMIEQRLLALAREGSWGGQVEEIDRAVELFESRGDERGLARAWLLRGEIANAIGNRTQMGSAAAHSAEHARRLGDHRAEAEALRLFAGALVYGPIPADEGIARIRELLDPGVPNRMIEAALISPLSALTAMRGEFRSARELVARAKRIYEELGLTFQLARLGFMSGRVERLAGDLEAAEREFGQGAGLLREMGERGRLAGMSTELAAVLCDQGKWDDAEYFLGLAGESSAQADHFFTRSLWARVLAHRGDPTAEPLARRAMEAAARTDDLTWRVDSVKNLADVLLVGGRTTEAVSVLREAIELCEAKANIAEAASTRALVEEIHAGVS